MRICRSLVGIVFTILFATIFVTAQSTEKKEDPKPPLGASASILRQWNGVGNKLIAMAEDLPEDKYDYKPHPDSRSFVEQLIHAASGMYYFTDQVNGKKVRYLDDPKRDEFKTKAQVIAFVKQCIKDGADLIKAKGDKGLRESVLTIPNRLTRVDSLANALIEHSAEHYGQLVVYYRVNNMVPPASRPK